MEFLISHASISDPRARGIQLSTIEREGGGKKEFTPRLKRRGEGGGGKNPTEFLALSPASMPGKRQKSGEGVPQPRFPHSFVETLEEASMFFCLPPLPFLILSPSPLGAPAREREKKFHSSPVRAVAAILSPFKRLL